MTHKYNASPRQEDGYRFDSTAEWRRYRELKLILASGAICDLVVHPRYELTINGVKVATYIADFSYHEAGRGLVVEDVKGVRTEVYQLKRKLIKALHGIDIVEVEP